MTRPEADAMSGPTGVESSLDRDDPAARRPQVHPAIEAQAAGGEWTREPVWAVVTTRR